MSIKDIYELGSLLSVDENEVVELERIVNDVYGRVHEQEARLGEETDKLERAKSDAEEQLMHMRSQLNQTRVLENAIMTDWERRSKEDNTDGKDHHLTPINTPLPPFDSHTLTHPHYSHQDYLSHATTTQIVFTPVRPLCQD